MSPNTPLVEADGPVLVFGGPCSNLQATEAVLAEAKRRAIPSSHVICTGDLAAYCGDPAATIDLVRSSGIHVVMGNCDEQLGLGAADCACGFTPGSECERLSAAWYTYSDSVVGADARIWLAALPRRIDLAIGGARLAVIHGSVSTINEFVFGSTPPGHKSREIARAGSVIDGVIGGHCGIPFTESVGGRLWHNPGIVGVPANDGTPRVWFSVLTPRNNGIEIEHCALGYDHLAAAAAMRRAGLPDAYACALTSGLWPSCDVLPTREIRMRGRALVPAKVAWQSPPSDPRSRQRKAASTLLWPLPEHVKSQRDAAKFVDPLVTARGEQRASVTLAKLETLWFNTGTLCNVTCANCYIASSPTNDRLAYLSLADIQHFLDEIEHDRLGTREIGFTGGEPFMCPEIVGMLETCLESGFDVLVLTNAMKPMHRHKRALADLGKRHGDRLTIRVSLDHFTEKRHDEERGTGSFSATLDGISWLVANGLNVTVAGRTLWDHDEAAERAGYAALFAQHMIPLDAGDPAQLVLFPEMDEHVDVPEITTACWGILGKQPADVMCATSRMVVKRKGADRPAVVACTLLPYEPQFELGSTLRDAHRTVPLNHPHCAKFCVLGGASCSAG